MGTFHYRGKTYEVDSEGFLLDFKHWDENFAEGVAPQIEIPHGLTREHWDVIYFIRQTFEETGRCPLIYESCRINGLRLTEMKKLFPTGYLRGSCKLAGVTYKESSLDEAYMPQIVEDLNMIAVNKIYKVDVRGFLVDPDEWDEYYAAHRAYDMKILGGKLTDRHWQVIRFLRESYQKNHTVPTVYEACEVTQIDIEELERLFPEGYHRGAVKIAGLRVR